MMRCWANPDGRSPQVPRTVGGRAAGAIVRRDGRQLEYSAHALKGPTLTFAATMAGPTTEELERSGQTNDFTAATRLLERLRGEIRGLIEGLTRLVETTPP